MANFELPFPLGGLNDNIAQSKQPSGTTGEAVNVRGQDPVTGRIRGAQRSGLTKFTVEPMDARIKRFDKVVYDNRLLRYTANNQPILNWEKDLGTNGYTVFTYIDNKENVYVCTSENKLLKYNKNGVLLYTLAPAIPEKSASLCGVTTDDAGSVWICTGHKDVRALSTSPSPLVSTEQLANCWIEKYTEQPGSEEPIKDYRVSLNMPVEKVLYKNGKLYALCNDVVNLDGVLVELGELFTTAAEVTQQRSISYPACDFDVDIDSAIYWTAAENLTRYLNQLNAVEGFRKTLVDWTPNDLNSTTASIWSWHAADAIENYENNEELLVWEDQTGQGRNYFKYAGGNVNGTSYPAVPGPLYKKQGLGQKPALLFGSNLQGPFTKTALYSDQSCSFPEDEAFSTSPVLTIKNQPITVFVVFKPDYDSFTFVANFLYYGKSFCAVDTYTANQNTYPSVPGAVCLASNAALFGSQNSAPVSHGPAAKSFGNVYNTEANEARTVTNTTAQTIKTSFRSDLAYTNPIDISGFGAGPIGEPFGTYVVPQQNAYIVSYTIAHRYLSPTVSVALQDDGVNCFDSLRINGRPIDRYLGPGGYGRDRYNATNDYGIGSDSDNVHLMHTVGMPYTHLNQNDAILHISGQSPYGSISVDLENKFPRTWFRGRIAEIIVAKHSDQTFTPRYPRKLGLACKQPTESITINATTTRTVSQLEIAGPLGVAFSPTYNHVVPGYQVTRTLGNKTTLYSGGILKAGGKYFNIAYLKDDFLVVGQNLNTTLPLGAAVINPAEVQSQAVPHDPSTITDCERIEGYLAWKYGIWHNLPSGQYVAPTLGPGATYSSGNYPHPFRNAPPAKNGLPAVDGANILHPTAIAACLNTIDGSYRWAINGSTTNYAGGIGWSIAVDKNKDIYTYGPPQQSGYQGITAAAVGSPVVVAFGGSGYFVGEILTVSGGVYVSQTQLTVIQVNAAGAILEAEIYRQGYYSVAPVSPVSVTSPYGSGATFNLQYNASDYLEWPDGHALARKLEFDSTSKTVSSGWAQPLGLGVTVAPTHESLPKLSVDSFGNVALPITFNAGVAENGWSVYATDSSNNALLLSSGSSDYPINSAVFEKVSPDYRIGPLPTDDFPSEPTTASQYPRGENIYVANENPAETSSVYRYELISATSALEVASPRAQALVAVAAGALKKITSSGVSDPIGVGSLPSPQFDAQAAYVDSAVLFGKIYFTDGVNYRVYDPRLDKISTWSASDSGILPTRCKLLTNWRGRAVLARGADDPHNWHMSEQGNPNNWDTFPPVQTATQAISGNNARAGLCPDLINSLIPYNDDLLLFGCDSSLWMMRGDPMAGGVFDLVSDVTGVAFGRSWAKDPEGTLYFFGSRGGVYMMKPGGIPVSMTQSTIERRLTEVNLSQFYVEMFWNTYDDGLHLLLMPFTDTATQTKHYFWERKAGAWYEDKFHVTKQPSAAVIVDGDAADDRCLLIGTYDANVVKWDKNATSDDGQIIDSKVVIGPVAPDDSEFDSRITNLAAVMAKQGTVNYKLYASTTPDDRGEPVASGQFVPGRNPIHLVRARGAFVWVELQQANAYTRWSLESMRLDAFPAGRKRNA